MRPSGLGVSYLVLVFAMSVLEGLNLWELYIITVSVSTSFKYITYTELKRDAFLIEIYQNLNSIGVDFVESKLDCIRLFTKLSQSRPSFQNTNSTLIELAKLKSDHDRVLKNLTQQQWSLKMWVFFYFFILV